MSTLSAIQHAALQQAARAAFDCQQSTALPAALTVAQWAVESGWGAHQPGNNCFGIKAYSGCFGTQLLRTIEVFNGIRVPVLREFATFATLAACFEKHATLITGGKLYSHAWTQYLAKPDLPLLIKGIAPVYATDPDYAHLLLGVLVMPTVQGALAACHPQLSTQ